MKTVRTKKGSELPLLNLRGKDYLQVAHRLQWLNDEYNHFTIDTEFLLITDEQTVAKAVVKLYDEKGVVIKSAMATKRETKKDFPDHTEKAETASVGRALAMLGMGTQMALSDLDEGERIVDSPVVNVKPSPAAEVINGALKEKHREDPKPEKPKSTFKVAKKEEAPKVEVPAKDFKTLEDEWK